MFTFTPTTSNTIKKKKMKMAKDMFEAFKIVKMNVKIDKRLT